jgi:nucleoid-associated protein YgaU
LGIAFLVVLSIAALLYALQRVHLGDAQGVDRQASGQSPSRTVGSKTGTRPEHISESPSQALERDASDSRLESSTSAPESLASNDEPPVATADSPDKRPSALQHDSITDADDESPEAAGSIAESILELPPTPSTSPEAASESSVSTRSAPGASSVRYYTVEQGDTLYGIARRIYGEGRHWKAVYDANKDLIDDARELTLGWKLELPPVESVAGEN